MTTDRSKLGRKFQAAFATLTATLAVTSAALVLPSGGAARAQGLPGEQNVHYTPPINAARDVSWDQKLDDSVTLNTPFRDETGKTVTLGSYFGKKPVVLVMPFYKCPGICTAEVYGMIDAFKDPQLQYKPYRDFEVITVSINPKEQSDLATMKKKEYLDALAQPGAENGWHFLTGTEASIKKLADDVGYRYRYDAKTDQYAHPSGIVVLTPQGKISRYMFGVMFPPKDLRLALTEAGHGRIGTVADKFVLACYCYDPKTGTYGLRIFRLLQVSGAATLIALASFMTLMIRKDARDVREAREKGTIPGAPDGEGEKTA